MKRRHLLLLTMLVATFALSGCGMWNKMFDRGGDIQPPKPLVKFDASVQVQKLWSTRIGDGAGRSGVRLQPTYADGKLYVISTNGKIDAVDFGEREVGEMLLLDFRPEAIDAAGGLATGAAGALGGGGLGDWAQVEAVHAAIGVEGGPGA